MPELPPSSCMNRGERNILTDRHWSVIDHWLVGVGFGFGKFNSDVVSWGSEVGVGNSTGLTPYINTYLF